MGDIGIITSYKIETGQGNPTSQSLQKDRRYIKAGNHP